MNRIRIATSICAALLTLSASAAAPPRHIERRVNDPALDSIQELEGTRPFVNTTNSESTIAGFGATLVSVFRTVGAELERDDQGVLRFTRNLRLGYSYSRDNGLTWRSEHLPPLPGSSTTLGYGMVASDRRGRFYASGLGLDASGRTTVTLNTAIANRLKFAPATAIDSTGRPDRPWLAVGPSPAVKDRDNVYLSWVSFDDSTGASVLRFAKSLDGGATFITKTLFAPSLDPNPANPQNAVQFPTIAVDPSSGRIYIAFLQFGFVSNDYIRILSSDDAGETFQPLSFHRPDAPSPEVYPVVQPGTYTECGATRFDPPGGGSPQFFPNSVLTVHAGPDIGSSASGAPRYVHATRVNLQPMIAATKGVLHLTWSNSTSSTFGEPTSGADILYMHSDNGGTTWSAAKPVNAPASAAGRSFTPTIAVGALPSVGGFSAALSPRLVHITYYTQEADGTLSVNLAQSKDGGGTFMQPKKLNASPLILAPTNIPLPTSANPYQTTNYDRLAGACSSLGEYMGLNVGIGRLHAVWGDSRDTIRQPDNALDPIAGQLHSKENVYFANPPIF